MLVGEACGVKDIIAGGVGFRGWMLSPVVPPPQEERLGTEQWNGGHP